MAVQPCRMYVVVIALLSVIVSCSPANGGYTITTPKRWTVGASGQICVSLTDPSIDGDYLVTSLYKTNNSTEVLAKDKILALAVGQKDACFELYLPIETSATKGQFKVDGSLLGKTVSKSVKVSILNNPEQIFIQTDKYLYKPGQKVQFRILAVKVPFLEVLTNKYPEIWVENPSGSRIAQWLNVENPNGLIHMSFQLSEEPEEGDYSIRVKPASVNSKSVTFKVEEYVLPKYEVTVKPPAYLLGTSKTAVFEVCAKYTFGQPVKGTLVLEVDNAGWGEYIVNIERKVNISGCATAEFSTDELNVNSKNYHAYSIAAKATVTEDGTGVVLVSDKKSVDISRTAISFEDKSVQKYYKPELPFIGEVQATFPDKNAAVNEIMNVCAGRVCKNFTTNQNGIVKFAVPPHIKETITITAVNFPQQRDSGSWRSIMYESTMRNNIKKYHSGSNSSLVIALSHNNLECVSATTIDFDLPIRFSTKKQAITSVNVQVISRGQIQFTSSTDQDLSVANDLHIPENLFLVDMVASKEESVRGFFTIPISLPVTVSPKAKVIVWFVRSDGEVVSDQRELDISKCLQNSVALSWSEKIAQPGDTADLTVEAEPMSLCSVGVVDKSVELLSSEHKTLTLKKLLEVAQLSSVRPYEDQQVDDYEYCKDKFVESDPIHIPAIPLPTPAGPPSSPPVALPSGPLEDLPLADDAMIRKKRSSFRGWNPYYSDDIDALHMFDEAGIYVISDLTLESRPCNRHYGSIDDRIFFSPPAATNFRGPPVFSKRRQNLPRLGQGQRKSGSQATSRTYFPETWLWELSIVESGSLVQPLVLPDTVTEWVGQAVCVHPSKGVGLSNTASVTTFRDFFVDLTLPATTKRGEIFPVKISVFNYLKEQLPVRVVLENSSEYDILEDEGGVIGSGERSTCIDPQDKTVLTVRIRPKTVGDVHITIDAMVDLNSVQCGTGSSQARRDVIVKPVKVEFEGFEKEKSWSQYVCSKDLEAKTDTVKPWVMETPAVIVEDSARGWVSIVGDLMGPTIENLGGLVKMPYGCGEQNMLNFAPNIYVMQYLDASNQTTKELAEKSIGFMEKGYQRELNYRHTDGSYSAFGSSDNSGSTWLTAFVLRCFFQAREFIQIDPTDLNMSQDWLRRKQLENGCFESVGKVLHKGMKGGIGKTDSPALLSAFVLISLMESGEDSSSPTVREALFCLDADDSVEAYSLAVRAYAFALAKSPKAQTMVDGLLSISTQTSSTINWDLPADSKSSKGMTVEIAAYAILALLATDAQKYDGETRKIVKWINNQRNGQGGFVSTQDTIIALQAMAAFERMLPSEPLDATVLFLDSTEVYEHAFTVNEHNKLLQQKNKLPSIPLTITGDVVGSGCILLQGVLRYNIPEAESSVAFNISVETSTPSDISCKTKHISVCASYLLEDKVSNMAIIEVNLVSGYIPVKADLKRVVGYGTGFFKRYEVDGSQINFYVDEFTSKNLCASFNILREVDVEQPKPGTVKVYDYYKPEYAVTQTYTLPEPTECNTTQPEFAFEIEILPAGSEIVESGQDLEAVRNLVESLDSIP